VFTPLEGTGMNATWRVKRSRNTTTGIKTDSSKADCPAGNDGDDDEDDDDEAII